MFLPCLGAFPLEAKVGDDGRISPKIFRDEESDAAHILHLGQLCRVIHLRRHVYRQQQQSEDICPTRGALIGCG